MFEHKINNNILLRLIQHNDAEDLFTTVEKNREFLRQWLPWVDETTTVEDINTFIRTSIKQYANNEGPTCVIVQDNEIIGIISFHGINTKNKSGGIGYWLSKDQNGKGIMTKCCKFIPEKIYESSLITLSKSRKVISMPFCLRYCLWLNTDLMNLD